MNKTNMLKLGIRAIAVIGIISSNVAAHGGEVTADVKLQGLTSDLKPFGTYGVSGEQNTLYVRPRTNSSERRSSPSGLQTHATAKEVTVNGRVMLALTNGTVAYIGDDMFCDTPGSVLKLIGSVSCLLPDGRIIYSGEVTFIAE